MAAAALLDPLSTILFDSASHAWLELCIVFVAGIIYLILFHVMPPSADLMSLKKKIGSGDTVTSAGLHADDDVLAAELRAQLARGDHRAAARMWKMATGGGCVPLCADLVLGYVESMRKISTPSAGIVKQLSDALNRNPKLITSVATLPDLLLRDDAIDLLEGVIALLDEHGRAVEPTIHAGIMSAQLRRKNFEAVAAWATRLPNDALTPRIRGILASAAAQRNRLDESLGHLRQMPSAIESGKHGLSSNVTVRILAIAAKEKRISEAAVELQRVHARLESRQLDELFAAEARRNGTQSAGIKQLLEVGSNLQVEKGSGAYEAHAHQLANAGGDACASDLLDILNELDVLSAKGSLVVCEPLALALFEACKVAAEIDLVHRTIALHTAACAGAPGPRALRAACAAFLDCEHPALACDFYEKEMAPKKVLTDATLTGLLAKAAVQSARHELAESLFEIAAQAPNEIAREDPHIRIGRDDVNRQITLMKQHGRDGKLSAAVDIFERLQAGRAPPSSMMYNCFIDVCVKCGDADRALEVFDEMKRLQVVDVVGYNTILKAHLGRGTFEAARRLLLEMSDAGMSANKVTFNELLHAKVVAKDQKGMWQIVNEMKAAGIPPNSVSCAILLKSLTMRSAHADVQRIMHLIDEMDEPVDEVLFSSVVEACMRIKQLGLLSDMMRRCKGKGKLATLTAPTYGSMIKAYGQAADIDRVWEVWNEMEDRGVRPTPITIGCMVEALVTNGSADNAWEFVQKLLRCEDQKDCVNTVIYSTLLKGFALMKRIDRVFDVYKEMRGQNISCNTITYNTMLDACAKCCTMDRAKSLLVDMRSTNVEPDIITYSTIVKGYCNEGDIDRAFRVLEEMKSDDRFSPDEIMYNSLLDGCAKQHRVDDALRVLEEMQSSGVGPSNYTLSILVKVLGRARRLGQAFKIVEDLSSKHGFRPNVFVYTCLMQACILNHRLERALSLHDTIVADQSCHIDEKLYAVLARGCLQAQSNLRAAAVVRFAYKLPGYRPLSSAQVADTATQQDGSFVGVDRRALDEVLSRLHGGALDEQAEAKRLSTDLAEYRGLSVSGKGGENTSHRPWRNGQRRGDIGARPSAGRNPRDR